MKSITDRLKVPAAKERLRVAVRVRPLDARERRQLDDSNPLAVVSFADTAVMEVPFDVDANKKGKSAKDPPVITSRKEPRRFQFDNVFWSVPEMKDGAGMAPVGQTQVYEAIGEPLVEHAFSGFNSCLFAYGQTGSGKTYTMMGPDGTALGASNAEAGIIPRVCEDIFRRKVAAERDGMVQWGVEIGYVEVYNERVSDLLAKRKRGKEEEDVYVEVRENPAKGVYLDGQKFVSVGSVEEVLQVLEKGNRLRHTASTKMNNRSSRSHAILMIVLKEQREMKTKNDVTITTAGKSSRMNLVDLAGSERVAQSEVEGMQFNEATHINLSLTTLGRVIDILADIAINPKANTMTAIPFRESKLTHILKESLRGNSKTFMIATVSPSLVHVGETISTLRYASRARDIVNVVQVNEDPRARRIRELELEIERLRDETSRNSADTQMAVVLDLQRRIALLTSEAEQRAAELQTVEKERERAKVQQELLSATEAERGNLEREARQLKEEVERSRRQADDIFAENNRLREDFDRMEQQLQEEREAKQMAVSVLRREKEQHAMTQQQQLDELQRQLQQEREARKEAEKELEKQQSRVRSALSRSMATSDEKRLLLDENFALSQQVTRLSAEVQDKNGALQRLHATEVRCSELELSNELNITALMEMERRYHNTVFFLMMQMDMRTQLVEREKHQLGLEFERNMSDYLQDAVAQDAAHQTERLALQQKFQEAVRDKNKLRHEVQELHERLSQAETHLLALQMEATSTHQMRDTTMKQLEVNLEAAKNHVQDFSFDREAMRKQVMELERERNELRIRLTAHRDRDKRATARTAAGGISSWSGSAAGVPPPLPARAK